jgi:hypothetical protein
LRYDYASNTTLGYVYSSTPLEIRPDLELIPAEFAKCPHPLLVPIFIHELLLHHLIQNLDFLHRSLRHTEAKTGFSDYGMELGGSRDRDYGSEIERLGCISDGFANDQVRVNNARIVNEFIRLQLSSIDKWLPEHHRRLAPYTTALYERSEFLWSTIQHMKMYRGLEMRLQSRQSVVSISVSCFCAIFINWAGINLLYYLKLFNLIAQQDSMSNIKIASAAKRDGFAMKITAVLATLFLPATFVAVSNENQVR